jgi:pimeloyl-ACP methyl ester carboxylesterase
MPHTVRRRWRTIGIALAGTALGLASAPMARAAVHSPAASTPVPGSPAAQLADSVPGIPGLPSGVPPAATAPPVVAPEPTAAEWPFPNDFSATLAPAHGSFSYPAGDEGDTADIFRAGIGLTSSASWWRVDWSTMPDPDKPIAEWTMTPSAAPKSATTTVWPGNAGVSTSTGIEYALLVTSKEAELLQAATGKVLATFTPTVVPGPNSFIVKIPRSILPVSGSWRVQLAAGVADPASSAPAFETVTPAEGGYPGGGANVYNITFRRAQTQEAAQVCPDYPFDPGLLAALENGLDDTGKTTAGVPTVECANNWMENDQANTLRGSDPDVSKYSLQVDWTQLADHVTVPAPQLHGYINRWYTTPLDLSKYGTGINPPSGSYTEPTYLGRYQPYAVEVPPSYNYADPSPTPLTWILHSLDENLNQYGTLDPTQVVQECDQRGSICATTEGFSEGQWYYAEAEVDFWDVWRQLADTYSLDPDATTLSGYSMGGWATYKLAEEYPSLFGQAMPLEGPVICGLRVYGQVQGYAGGTQCTTDGDSTPLLVNLKWIPYVMTCGIADELVPYPGCNANADALRAMNPTPYRVDEFTETEDHLVYPTQNDFTQPDSRLERPAADRVLDPASFDYVFYPDLITGPAGVDGIGTAGQIGPTGAYWVSGLTGRDSAPGALASVAALSDAIPQPTITASETTSAGAPGPTGWIEQDETWTTGSAPPTHQAAFLRLTDVATASVDTLAAGLTCAVMSVTTDGPTTLTLTGLQPRSTLIGTSSTANSHGTATIHLGQGTTALSFCTTRADPG